MTVCRTSGDRVRRVTRDGTPWTPGARVRCPACGRSVAVRSVMTNDGGHLAIARHNGRRP